MSRSVARRIRNLEVIRFGECRLDRLWVPIGQEGLWRYHRRMRWQREFGRRRQR